MNWALVSIRGFARVSLIVAAVVGCASSVDDYAIARSQNSRAAYEGFIKRHPESAEARIARVQLEEIYAWETARSWNNLGSYKDFLSRFPNSQFAAQAESARDLLVETYEWKNVTKVDRAYVYERFVKRFPNGSHAVEAKSRRDVAQAQTQAKVDAWMKAQGSLPVAIGGDMPYFPWPVCTVRLREVSRTGSVEVTEMSGFNAVGTVREPAKSGTAFLTVVLALECPQGDPDEELLRASPPIAIDSDRKSYSLRWIYKGSVLGSETMLVYRGDVPRERTLTGHLGSAVFIIPNRLEK